MKILTKSQFRQCGRYFMPDKMSKLPNCQNGHLAIWTFGQNQSKNPNILISQL